MLPTFYDWLYWINPMAWALQGLVVNEFTSVKYEDYFAQLGQGIGTEIGAEFLKLRGFKTTREWVWFTFAFMIPFGFLSGLVLGTEFVAGKRASNRLDQPQPFPSLHHCLILPLLY